MTTRTCFAVLTTALLMAAGAWAAVPQSLSYQGYLTDHIGSPISDSQTITFAIYTVPVGGVPVWQETKSVAFANGLFSVRLGELTAFPPDLFDVPLWLGMTIGTDSEMEPRQPLTTAAFSFRAEDADGLQGRSAAELDQSLHVDDEANPHVVTAGQTGAATQLALDVHATNTGNPHTVSVAQTGGTSATTFGSHAAETAAHHARYADAEAQAAMGPQQDANPLNHARFADTEAVSAVIAADGKGSGLDADLVDGLQATEIINAATNSAVGIRYEFAGFSEAAFTGDAGLLAFYNACQDTFGTGTRMSNSAEILATPSLSAQPNTAWVQPTIIGFPNISFSGTSAYVGTSVDISGAVANFSNDVATSGMSCDGWSKVSATIGLAIDGATFSFDANADCNTARRVACSVPINN